MNAASTSLESKPGVKILVIDDEKLIRLTMSAALRREGYTPIAVGTVDEAVALLHANSKAFSAIITDVVMGDIDGFAFRDLVRGIDPSMPMFFLTGLDPEEGSGFLKKILSDPSSFYMPKAVSNDILLRRLRQIVASRRVKMFIERKISEDAKSLDLAANIQHSMLPIRSVMTPCGFYRTWWRPMDIVSGDLYEACPFGEGCYLYVLGDIQGHGTSAALAMTAVQSFLRTLMRRDGAPYLTPAGIANLLQGFFRSNLAEVSYMTALICIHRPLAEEVSWISCGAPDLIVIDGGKSLDVNPEHRGGMPIGLILDTKYAEEDIVTTHLTRTAVCIAHTDGLFDLSSDAEGFERLATEKARHLMEELSEDARSLGMMPAFLAKFMKACEDFGFTHLNDDVTMLTFCATNPIDGVYEATFSLSPVEIDSAAQKMGDWCRANGWSKDVIGVIQLVFEEKLMNVFDHGFDDRARLHEVASVRLARVADDARLTVWDNGTTEPSIVVTTGDSSTAFEIANDNMSGHGRGRLMVRELCKMIERNQYGRLNETVYHISLGTKQ